MANSNYYTFLNDATTTIMTKEVVVRTADDADMPIGWIARVGNSVATIIHTEEIDALRNAIDIYVNDCGILLHQL